MKNNAIKPKASRLDRILILDLANIIKKFDFSNLEFFIATTIRPEILIINATEIPQFDQFRNQKIVRLAEWIKIYILKHLMSEPLQNNNEFLILLIVKNNIFFFPTDRIKKEVVKYEI
ncbi:hypothetical protein ES705_18774 [subsurface metagenome]